MGSTRYGVVQNHTGKKHILNSLGKSLCGMVSLSYIEAKSHVTEENKEEATCQFCRKIAGLKYTSKPEIDKKKNELFEETVVLLEELTECYWTDNDNRKDCTELLRKYREVVDAEDHN